MLHTFSMKNFLRVGLASSFLSVSFAFQVGVIDESSILNSPMIAAHLKPMQDKIADYDKTWKSIYTEFLKVKDETDALRLLRQLPKTLDSVQAYGKDANLLDETFRKYITSGVTRMAEKNKYDIVVSKQNGIVYVSPKVDATARLVEVLTKNVLDEIDAAQ